LEEVDDFEPGTGNNFETRWECRLDSVKAIIFQLDNICVATENLLYSCDDSANVIDYESEQL
jgi:hypothetical protein